MVPDNRVLGGFEHAVVRFMLHFHCPITMFFENRSSTPAPANRIGYRRSSRGVREVTLISESQGPLHKLTMGFAIPSILNPLPPETQVNYFLGLRGILAVQTFIFLFLQVFAPTTVKDSLNSDGPTSQQILRKTVSVLFWNGSLTYSSIVVLSARTIVLPFFSDPSKSTAASSLFRRPIRLAIPVAVALGISTLMLHFMGRTYISDFLSKTGNKSVSVPTPIPSFLVYFNSVFTLFWATRDFSLQNGSTGFPSQTLWIVSVIFQQSYTLYMTMIIIPYTRYQWRIKALILFILTAWWVQSWAWYSITGLLFADLVHTSNLRQVLGRGLPIKIWTGSELRIPIAVPSILCMFIGFMMQYFWVAWKPQDVNGELIAHGGIYLSLRFNEGADFTVPQPRVDNYLVILGFFLLLECSQRLRWILDGAALVWLGKRSYSKNHNLFFEGVTLTYDRHLSHLPNCHILGWHQSLYKSCTRWRYAKRPSHLGYILPLRNHRSHQPGDILQTCRSPQLIGSKTDLGLDEKMRSIISVLLFIFH
jgi:hypothetical protein